MQLAYVHAMRLLLCVGCASQPTRLCLFSGQNEETVEYGGRLGGALAEGLLIESNRPQNSEQMDSCSHALCCM